MNINRRRFLASAGALGLGATVLQAGSIPAAPARRIRHVCIGLGGMGNRDFAAIAAHPMVDVVAVCDIDETRAKQVRAEVPKAKYYQDQPLFSLYEPHFSPLGRA